MQSLGAFVVADVGQEGIALRSVAAAAGAVAVATVGVVVVEHGFGGRAAVDGGLGLSQVALADGKAVEGFDVPPFGGRLRARREVVFEILPVVAALVVGAKSSARVVAAMDHAIFAARVA